jgi:hypothetical protein
MSEEIERRFWITITSANGLDRNFSDYLFLSGFEETPTGYTKKTTVKDEARFLAQNIANLIKSMGFLDVRLIVTVQPQCRSCNKWVRFSATACECGGAVTPKGFYDYEKDRITYTGGQHK